ncbi:Uncharacterised protein [Mycolicibacterium aurum]|uniref:Uncharacterized protein n=1 Tax=Mycolicibacterium aurum TaxID=1791 RepID=A0A448IRU2_MYCAU|nr:Uncharacterised protein [Mycolicibacterium aurum]
MQILILTHVDDRERDGIHYVHHPYRGAFGILVTVEIVWRQRYTDRLRSVQVGWDDTEAGAPCFPPHWEPAPDDLHLLRIATAYGACPPGEYVYRRPPRDVEHSRYVELLAEESTFDFTGQHRQLLTALRWEMTDPYTDEEVPGANPKRPYGDFTFYQLEIALALGLIPAQKPADHDPMTPQIVEAMTALHDQMQPALQVFLQRFHLPEGQAFAGEDWGGWTPCES